MGELAALCAALCWAVGSLLFSRLAMPAAAINLAKNILSAIALAVTVVAVTGVFHADGRALLWLTASAVIGLVIGDTCHFRAIQVLGPRRSVVLETFAPVIGAVIGWCFLAERLGPVALLGIAVTLGGVLFVIRERSAVVGNLDRTADPRLGVGFGLSAAACQATGAALSKVGMRRLEELGGDVGAAALEASCLRLVVAAAIGFALAAAGRRLLAWRRAAAAPGTVRVLVPAAFVGSYAGVWLSMIAFQRTEIAVATTLSALSPVFILPLVAGFLGERITLRAVAGALLAVGGVAILAARA